MPSQVIEKVGQSLGPKPRTRTKTKRLSGWVVPRNGVPNTVVRGLCGPPFPFGLVCRRAGMYCGQVLFGPSLVRSIGLPVSWMASAIARWLLSSAPSELAAIDAQSSTAFLSRGFSTTRQRSFEGLRRRGSSSRHPNLRAYGGGGRARGVGLVGRVV